MENKNEMPIWQYINTLDNSKISRLNQIILCIKRGYSDKEIRQYMHATQEYINIAKKKDIQPTYKF